MLAACRQQEQHLESYDWKVESARVIATKVRASSGSPASIVPRLDSDSLEPQEPRRPDKVTQSQLTAPGAGREAATQGRAEAEDDVDERWQRHAYGCSQRATQRKLTSVSSSSAGSHRFRAGFKRRPLGFRAPWRDFVVGTNMRHHEFTTKKLRDVLVITKQLRGRHELPGP